MRVTPQQLQLFLEDLGLVSKEKFEELLKKAEKEKKTIEEILLQEKIVSEDNLIKIKAYILGIPFINLEKEKVAPEILNIIPEKIAKTYQVAAFRKKGENLEVAMVDPENIAAIEILKKATGLRILPRLTTKESIKNLLSQYGKELPKEIEELQKEKFEIEVRPEEKKEAEAQELERLAQELPIVKIVDTILKHAISQRASDIHIEPHEKEVLVRYRIDGILRDVMSLPKISGPGLVARIKVLANLRLDERRLPQDGRFQVEGPDYKYSIRVSTLPVVEGEKVVMRLLAEGAKALSLEELGLRSKALEDVKVCLKKPLGMILVCGPTGSGKTTTLYSMLSILNKPQVNICTLEDPVEYRIPRVNQTQINPKIGLTFATGLRSLLRQDPDILMVGEIRDKETADLAVNAALTGHLVLSTLHTNSAAGAIPRLLEMGVEPFLLSSTLNLILAQRLVRRLEEKEKYFLTKEEQRELSKYCDLERILEILKREGICKKDAKIDEVPFFCPKKTKESEGYKGRIGIFEVLVVSKKIKEMIVQRKTAEEIEQQAKKEGMLTMVEDGFVKAALGITSIEEVLRVIIE